MALTFKESLAYFWQQIVAQFVRKEGGKGLSSNDFTDAEKEKLAAAVLSVNGVEPDENGNVELEIATDDDILALMMEVDALPVVMDESGAIMTDEEGAILLA